MPYTPPAHQQSPASSKTNSPVVSRSSSWSEHDGPRSPVTGRPQLPRSHSSSSYLHKHRRSPSFQKSEAPPTPTEITDNGNVVHARDFANGSVRQSPPPVNNLLIPTGAVISPPDSSENSGDEDGANQRGRELENKWDQLQQAVRGIDLKRDGSPDKVGLHRQHETASSEPVSQTTSPTALTPEARKISHSRSSTENAIIIPRQTAFAESPSHTSDDSDDSDEPLSKPSLVRKKSGELVKPALRPSSRRRYSSMPGTPTYSKSVHFNESENQTRHFLQVDKPMAVSAGSSPVETYDSETEYPFEKVERGIRLANFPADTVDRQMKPVRVERIYLSADKQGLIGTVAVQNIAFHKLVVARFTFDYWKTTSEVVAEYNNDVKAPSIDNCDRFTFHINLSDAANVDDKTLLLCVRYNVGTQEFWDNNNDGNYHIDFTKSVVKSKPSVNAGLGTRPLNAIPRSRHSPRGRQESVDDDFATRVDTNNAYSFNTPTQLLDEPTATIKLKPRTKRGSMFPGGVAQQQANGLGGRYDFGASLSAALTNAQDKLGRSSGLMMSDKAAQQKASKGYFGLQERKEGPTKIATPDQRPDALTTDRPAMGSDQYRDLVQKFCYFTPTAGVKGATSPVAQPKGQNVTSAPQTESAQATQSSVSSLSTSTSGNSTPIHNYDGSNDRVSPALSPFVSRTGSPSPVTGQSFAARAVSPVSFGYPYHSRDGYLSDSPLPTAIQG